MIKTELVPDYYNGSLFVLPRNAPHSSKRLYCCTVPSCRIAPNCCIAFIAFFSGRQRNASGVCYTQSKGLVLGEQTLF